MMNKLLLLLLIFTSLTLAQSSKLLLLLGDDGKSEPVINIEFTGTATGNIVMRGTDTITVDWDDGNIEKFGLTGADKNIAHTYSGSGTYNIKIYKPERITKWWMISNTGSWIMTSKYLSSIKNLRYQSVTGTFTINSVDIPNVEELHLQSISGTQTIKSADMKKITLLVLESISGTQTINSIDLTNVTNLVLINLSGTQNIDTKDLSNLSSIFYLKAITGSIKINASDLTNITNFTLINTSATYSGNWSSLGNATTIFYVSSGKAFNITDGTFPAWTNTTITITPTGTGYTTAEIDGFLNGWAPNAGTGTKTIDLRGANQSRSSSSDAAVFTLIGKNKTILTNP